LPGYALVHNNGNVIDAIKAPQPADNRNG